MQYSSAIWTAETTDLEAAQTRKLDRIVDMLGLAGGERVLEIGCGWGALATRLAGSHDAEVTAITLSPAQLAFAQGRAAERGLDRRIDFRLQDYRDIAGRFDRIVSIEMIEAVGKRTGRLLPDAGRDAETGRPRRRSRRSRSARRTSSPTAAIPISSRSTSSPAAACRPARVERGRRRPG